MNMSKREKEHYEIAKMFGVGRPFTRFEFYSLYWQEYPKRRSTPIPSDFCINLSPNGAESFPKFPALARPRCIRVHRRPEAQRELSVPPLRDVMTAILIRFEGHGDCPKVRNGPPSYTVHSSPPNDRSVQQGRATNLRQRRRARPRVGSIGAEHCQPILFHRAFR
jgi:hypothetical protein